MNQRARRESAAPKTKLTKFTRFQGYAYAKRMVDVQNRMYKVREPNPPWSLAVYSDMWRESGDARFDWTSGLAL